MNSTEQRQHRTVTQQLDARVENLEAVVTEGLPALRRGLVRAEEAIGEERTRRLRLAQEQRSYVDNEDRMLRQSIQQLQCRTVLSQSTFWQRLRWLLRGSGRWHTE